MSPTAAPVTGLVVSYRFLWPREHDRNIEHGSKARPACVVVPITQQGNIVVLFPLTTQEPGADRVVVQVPDTERRRLRLRGTGPSWIILDEGNRDIMPGSFHLEPISYDPPVHAYGRFSQAFMHQVLRALASAIQARRLRTITRES